MSLLRQLAADVASKDREYGFASKALPETLAEVGMLLEHEVDFRREQATLGEAYEAYRSRSGIRVPRLIPELCTDAMTAMSFESGVKITEALAGDLSRRQRVAAQIVEAAIAAPLFSPQEHALFHADPHAGNLLYDESRSEVVMLDWALTDTLSREHRRHTLLLGMMLMLRDAAGVCREIEGLSENADDPSVRRVISESVGRFFRDLPHAASLGSMDAMKLMDAVALQGVRFPACMAMFRKVMFTLDGVLHDLGGKGLDFVIARDLLSRWMASFGRYQPPLTIADWFAVERSILHYASGFWAWTSPVVSIRTEGQL
jgi:ubiquinone biosynthesis protein